MESHPIVIDSRDAVPTQTVKALIEIGIFDKALTRMLFIIALRSSIEMACYFIGNFD